MTDLISREALKEALKEKFDDFIPEGVYDEIDNAPAVDLKNQAYDKGFITAMKLYSKPKGGAE